MEKFLLDISSVYWWLGVVIVGIIINIISSYIKTIMESKLSNVSSYWKNKRQERLNKIDAKISLLKNNKDLRIIYAIAESRHRTRALTFFVFGLTSMSVGFEYENVYAIGFSLLFFLLGMDDHREAMKTASIINQSIEDLEKLYA